MEDISQIAPVFKEEDGRRFFTGRKKAVTIVRLSLFARQKTWMYGPGRAELAEDMDVRERAKAHEKPG